MQNEVVRGADELASTSKSPDPRESVAGAVGMADELVPEESEGRTVALRLPTSAVARLSEPANAEPMSPTSTPTNSTMSE